MVPERTFVQEEVEKLNEVYREKGKQALFPFFSSRLNPRWPKDKRVLDTMKERINEIRRLAKEETEREDATR